MSDFHQNGNITTLHNLRTRSLDDLEYELQAFAESRRITLVLPCLYSELEGPALPNILAGRALVPEFLQEQAEPAALARAATLLLDNPGARAAQREAFARIAATLHQDTDAQAAQAVLDLCAPA